MKYEAYGIEQNIDRVKTRLSYRNILYPSSNANVRNLTTAYTLTT